MPVLSLFISLYLCLFCMKYFVSCYNVQSCVAYAMGNANCVCVESNTVRSLSTLAEILIVVMKNEGRVQYSGESAGVLCRKEKPTFWSHWLGTLQAGAAPSII